MAARSRTAPNKSAVLAESDPRQLIVLVSLLELRGDQRARAIETVAAALAPAETPVFVTDDADFRAFAHRQYLYEYLPPLGEQAKFGSAAEWEAYLANRLRILLRKWAPVRIVTAGVRIEDFVTKAGSAQ
jgi:hypothetical protein